ncbi:hypothetical protein ATEIFO6365_0010031900 [Aspergillus terreus]|uniref:Uncharacterized protein n=1 Tax=Aspergillus terreus TaxID=33178 RepID=A0A5M3Z9M5_ASPTE|nr:hypothetical protein ATETN484_0012029800 [Aspergillus terreus]GFF19546.1 hypothetical protein ATEIFO6365_0010031900 [Aspergillus terreus]
MASTLPAEDNFHNAKPVDVLSFETTIESHESLVSRKKRRIPGNLLIPNNARNPKHTNLTHRDHPVQRVQLATRLRIPLPRVIRPKANRHNKLRAISPPNRRKANPRHPPSPPSIAHTLSLSREPTTCSSNHVQFDATAAPASTHWRSYQVNERAARRDAVGEPPLIGASAAEGVQAHAAVDEGRRGRGVDEVEGQDGGVGAKGAHLRDVVGGGALEALEAAVLDCGAQLRARLEDGRSGGGDGGGVVGRVGEVEGGGPVPGAV